MMEPVQASIPAEAMTLVSTSLVARAESKNNESLVGGETSIKAEGDHFFVGAVRQLLVTKKIGAY